MFFIIVCRGTRSDSKSRNKYFRRGFLPIVIDFSKGILYNETSIITLNANGGTIPVTSGWTNASDNKTATKELTYGNEYGELPTPVRTNYLFAGWEDENNNIITSSSTVSNAIISILCSIPFFVTSQLPRSTRS